MKRLIHIICIAVIVLLCTNVSGSSFLSFDGEKKDVILRKILKTVHINRDDFIDISATYYEGLYIELLSSGLKDASIYIFDSNGQEIFSEYFYGEIPSYYIVDIPQKSGRYYLVIDTSSIYAEGSFTIE